MTIALCQSQGQLITVRPLQIYFLFPTSVFSLAIKFPVFCMCSLIIFQLTTLEYLIQRLTKPSCTRVKSNLVPILQHWYRDR